MLRSGAVQVGSGLSAVAAFFAVVATFACLVPAARATRVNPLDALRAE